MKIFCCYTPSHTRLYYDDFLPTVPAAFTVHPEVVDISGDGNYHTQQFVDCVTRKVDLILKSLHGNSGDVIIWSDVDIQFYRLTRELTIHELGDHDIAFQSAGTPPKDINSGFFICRCNDRVIRFFEKVRDRMRNEDAGDLEEWVINRILPTLNPSELCWRYLPRRFYARSNRWPPPRDLVLYHANATPGANGVELKHRRLREMALLQKYGLPVLLYTCVKYAPRRVLRLWKEMRRSESSSARAQMPKPAAL